MICCRRACLVCAIVGFSALATRPGWSQTPPPAPQAKPAQTPPPKPVNPFENVPEAKPQTPPATPQPAPAQQPKLEAPKPTEAPKPVQPGSQVIESIEFRGARRVPQDTLRAQLASRKGDIFNEEI